LDNIESVMGKDFLPVEQQQQRSWLPLSWFGMNIAPCNECTHLPTAMATGLDTDMWDDGVVTVLDVVANGSADSSISVGVE
jgi:hypothetical protein